MRKAIDKENEYHWKKADARVLVDSAGFSRAVIVRGKYRDWEWFAGGRDGLGSILRSIKRSCLGLAKGEKA